ncbi:putative wd domain protein [Neofusicoccum parvum UCRNP2]|uniref:Putative wd domain protein n=1 Tax=Botryosphaeria parva (strain UCR-NP2) TaxID=1287680 RepID=R1EJT3_BOTPV|nr:putative wd domain protein [Neofusicoccum parvum UCRNP2]
MAGPTAVQDAPSTPKDARRKRKAKDSSAGNHDAKRIRTQDEENAAGAPPSGGNQAKAETALAIVGDKAGQLTKAGKNDASKPRKKQHADKSSWYTSEPAGGRFLQIDPIFSRDERFLIFATAKAVHIYSTANSLLVRTLPMNTSHSITAYALSSIDPDHLYVSDASGFVVLWDWMSGKKVNRWNLAAPVRGIATSAVDGPTGEKVETVFTLDKGEHSIIHAHRLRGRKDASESSAQPLLKTRVPLQSFTVAGQGQVIAAAAKDRVFVGQIKNTSTATLKDLIFIWRELSCTQKITSIDVQVKGAEKKTPKKGAPSSTGQVNLVIGCTNGALFLYEDIVAKLSQAEKQQKKDSKEPSAAPSLAPRTLHWHRNPVGTVKWSLDGNYIISGAITRNNATIFNQGPGATKLREPDLRHLQLSHDGKWLATVEEWIPPVEDVEHLAAEKTMIEEERRVRREVYLKFWLWNEEKAQWMLESRIDAPHQFTDKLISGRVFDLNQGLVHFVDPTAGSVRYSRGGLYSTGLVEIAFVGRQFIILSNSLSVWDLVDDELSYGYSFRPLGLTRAQKAEIIHLAINNTDGTFALSLPLPEQQKKASKLESADAPAPTAATQKEPSSTTKKRMSKIFVFSTASPRPLYSVVVPQLVTALLPAGSRKGFVALNTAAELRVIAPKTAGFQLVGPVAAAEESLGAFVDEETALEPLVEDEEDDKVEEKLPTEEELEEGVAAEGDQGDKPVVRLEMLAGVFDVGPSFALPPVRDLFEAVVGLYARKPRAVAAV